MPEVVTKQQMWKDMFGGEVDKKAELAQTYDMPMSISPKKAKEPPGGEKAVINKTASADVLDESDVLDAAFGAPSVEKVAQQVGGRLRSHVDVTALEPSLPLMEKKAEYYACPSMQRYPLDGYDQVIKAAAYFDEYGGRMDPAVRREYCSNLVKRASVLRVKVSPEVERYGADTYAPPHQIKIALDARRLLLQNSEDGAVLDKLAEQQPMLAPELFAATLEEFDKRTLLNHHYGDIPDAYFSTFSKVAAKAPVTESSAPSDSAIVIGNEYLTKEQLFEFSKRGGCDVKSRFGEDFASEFAKDPQAIFDSLPIDQKLVLMRMANSSKSQALGATAS